MFILWVKLPFNVNMVVRCIEVHVYTLAVDLTVACICVCVCVCTCYKVRTTFLNLQFEDIFQSEDILTSPHNVKGLFEC